MWEELLPPNKVLPTGVIVVDQRGRFRFGAKTTRDWQLRNFKSIKILRNKKEKALLGIQLFENEDGTLPLKHERNGSSFAAAWIMRLLKIEPGRYHGKREDNFITINLSKPLTEGQIRQITEMKEKRNRARKKGRSNETSA